MLRTVEHWWRIKLTAFLVAMILVNLTTWIVTGLNQEHGLYAVDADSIGIPRLSTLVASLLMLPILGATGVLSKNDVFVKQAEKGITHISIVRVSLLLLGYATALSFAVGGAVAWSSSGHYPIAATYLVLCVVFLVGLICDWREGLSGYYAGVTDSVEKKKD